MMLKACFIETWKEVESHYNKGLICSERHLQAIIYHSLVSQDYFKEYLAHVEPKIIGSGFDDLGLTGIIPDLIISKKQNIVAAVEIKYVPHGYIPFEKDLKNLCKFWRLKRNENHHIYLAVDPLTGLWNYEKKYVIDDDFLLIYCIIGKEDSYAFTNETDIWDFKYTNLTEPFNYLMFKGIINPNSKPTFSFVEKEMPM